MFKSGWGLKCNFLFADTSLWNSGHMTNYTVPNTRNSSPISFPSSNPLSNRTGNFWTNTTFSGMARKFGLSKHRKARPVMSPRIPSVLSATPRMNISMITAADADSSNAKSVDRLSSTVKRSLPLWSYSALTAPIPSSLSKTESTSVFINASMTTAPTTSGTLKNFRENFHSPITGNISSDIFTGSSLSTFLTWT